jgi:hypothetical protein
MYNKGIELSLDYDWIRPLKNDGFACSSTFIFTQNKNEITYIDEVTTSPFSLAYGGAYKVGYPIRSLFSFQYAGLNSTGQPQWYKADGSISSLPLTSSDLNAIVFSGGTDPKLNISFTNEFRYKGLNLSFLAVYYGGHFFRGRPSPTPMVNYFYTNSLPSYLLDSWTPTNTDTDVPASGQYFKQGTADNQLPYSDFLVRPADFIKIRNIVLAYTLPSNIASKIKASSIKLRFQMNNPKILWTKQKDVQLDPETGGQPIPASYVFGINVNF